MGLEQGPECLVLPWISGEAVQVAGATAVAAAEPGHFLSPQTCQVSSQQALAVIFAGDGEGLPRGAVGNQVVQMPVPLLAQTQVTRGPLAQIALGRTAIQVPAGREVPLA